MTKIVKAEVGHKVRLLLRQQGITRPVAQLMGHVIAAALMPLVISNATG